MAVGQYRDEFIRTEAGWRFSFRQPTNIFLASDFSKVVVRKADEQGGWANAASVGAGKAY
jgi:hypothetical protein